MNPFHFTGLPPLTLYIHIPWCVRKCPYCDFNSHGVKEDIPEGQYIDALLADLEQDLPLVWGRQVSAIFIGGGTPSLFSPEGLERLLSQIRARIPFNPGTEITLEANPGTVEQSRFEGFRAAGINRLSIGVQSFADAQLQALGRIHSAAEACRAIEAAFRAGFDNINLDLMFGLPGQSMADAQADVKQAIVLNPTHISYYQLTIEPNTLFHARPPALPDDERIWDMQTRGLELLAQHGYQQYEISAYARGNRQCVHNRNYWRFGDYLGIGAGAHGKISDAQHQRITRLAKTRHPQQYLQSMGGEARKQYLQSMGGEARIASRKLLSAQDAAFEYMLNALRLVEGVAVEDFEAHTGLPFSAIESSLKLAQQRELLQPESSRIRPTAQGRRYLNDLLEIFLPDSD
jgi:putative oxygen-independent coproporphyrinogen III oxidase